MGKRGSQQLKSHCGEGEAAHEGRTVFSGDLRGPAASGPFQAGGCYCNHQRQDPPGDNDESRCGDDESEQVFESQ
jgi:hypothetical protein